jgi:hypothetical protein
MKVELGSGQLVFRKRMSMKRVVWVWCWGGCGWPEAEAATRPQRPLGRIYQVQNNSAVEAARQSRETGDNYRALRQWWILLKALHEAH